MGKFVQEFKDRFKNKGIDEEDILNILEKYGTHEAISIIRKKYPQATDDDIDDLIGRYATTPFRGEKIPTFEEFIAEGTWALSRSSEKRHGEGITCIQKIKDFKEEIYNIFGDDILFDQLDGVIRRIKELMVLPNEEIKEGLNEDVDIPASLSTRYVAVKKQLADKQTQKDQLLKQINQKDLEMNILQKNINAIESQAADLQGQAAKVAQPAATTGATPTTGTTTTTTTAPAKESVQEHSEWEELDERLFGKRPDPIKPFLDAFPENSEEGKGWEDLPTPEDEPLHPEDFPEDSEDFGLGDTKFGTDIDRFNESSDDDIDIVESPDEDDKDGGEVEEISPDYLFALRLIRPEDDEEIIAKIYRNEDDEFWKIRVVQGDERPLEQMQLDPEMTMVDIIEDLAEIYDEVEEVDIEDYKDLIDDKEESDEKFYGKDKTEKVKEEL